jgi:hypothetical protein
VAIANRVVYFQSLDGNLYALDEHARSADSALLARIQTGGTWSGPAISDGHVFEGTGDALRYFFVSPTLYASGSIICLGLPPEKVHDMPGDLAQLGSALVSAHLQAAAGFTNSGQAKQAADAVCSTVDKVVDDLNPSPIETRRNTTGKNSGSHLDFGLAGIINAEEPSVNALRGDLKAYFVAVLTGDTAGAAAEAAAFKVDINAIVAALNIPTVDQTRLAHDVTTQSAAVDKVMTDELSHNLSTTAQDAAAEFAALDALFNDLVAGRYGISL